jgi:hypothetical protein
LKPICFRRSSTCSCRVNGESVFLTKEAASG